MLSAIGDINADCFVTHLDTILLGAAFGSTPVDPNWNPDADLNKDNIIDDCDASIIQIAFGWNCD